MQSSYRAGMANADRRQRMLVVHLEWKKKSFGGWAWGIWSVQEGGEIRKLKKVRP